MITEKGILVGIGLVFAGVVGYKVIQKKKPEWIKSVKVKAAEMKNKTCDVIKGAGESFKEGYAKA